MLEMMPGSIIDKTNNNLSNLVCAHSTIEQKTDPGKGSVMEATIRNENPVSYLNLQINKAEDNVNASEKNGINNDLFSNETINNVLDKINESNVISQEAFENNDDTQEIFETDVLHKTNESNVVFHETIENNIIQGKIENNVVSPEATENNVSHETTENNINFHEKTEIVVISQEINNEPDVLDDTTKNKIDPLKTPKCNMSQETPESNTVLRETNETTECNIVLPKINETIENNIVLSKTNETTEIHILSESNDENIVLPKTNETNVLHERTENCVLHETSKNYLVSHETPENNVVSQEIIKSKQLSESHDILSTSCELGNEKKEKDSTNSLNRIKIKNKENKLLSFLERNKLTIKDLLPKLKYFRRQTKDKRKPNCVLSLKLNRFYFKSNKPKWSSRQRGNKTTARKAKKEKEKPLYIPHSSTSSLDDVNNEENSLDKIIPDFKTDDDIRNKIKEQLELLRQSKKQIFKPQLEPEIFPEKSIPDIPINPPLEENPKLFPSSLEEVLLSKGDGELSIVSVVGGYFSDDDSRHSIEKAEDKKDYLTLTKGVSITDILLRREFNSHLITPTKTNDITKIKGWRTKHFTSLADKEDTTVEEGQEKQEEESKQTVQETENTIENPIPSTSSGYNDNEIKLDNILKTGENAAEKNTKSAFVSDVLDTFLSNHAKLKISYEVPKLVAEEAITKPQSEMPVGNNDYLKVVHKSPYKKKPANKVFKPKTLAEKRRMLEQDRQNQMLHDMETNESIYMKQLEYCEKRNKNEVAKDVRENLLAKETPFSRHCWNMATKLDKDARQFVIVNGNKIRILGSAGGNDIIVPDEVKRKVSNNKIYKREVSYKPGPLSRKHKLISNKENWECKVLKMPKIKLVVCPEPGKPLPRLAEQYIHLYRGEKGFISDELAKFAVSAVRTTKTVKNEYEFDVPYRNGQNKLLVRKKIFRNTSHDRKKEVLITPKKEYTDIDVEDCIKTVMSGMLNCIENQGLDKVVIKDDPDLKNKKDKYIDRPPSPIDPRVQAIIKRPNARKSKTTLELRRLNVQVIEVDVKEEEQDNETCNKDFCKLGCVCKSLRGATSLVPEHCGKVSCMLECSCSFSSSQRGHHSITLPAGTDLLSASTVVRLQDEVKRKLAKEEREFAQTVIKANNQTIMVGGGARERTRRVPKVPKKYSNFVSKQRGFSYEKLVSSGLLEEDDDFESQISKHAIQKAKENIKKDPEQRVVEVELKKPVPIWNKQVKKMPEIHNCHIRVTKLKLDNTVPWCMVHNLYKCHCDGKVLFETPPKNEQKKEEFEKKELGEEEYIPYAPRFQPRYFPENPPPVITDLSEKYCARTRAIGTNYYQARNKSQSFKARYALIKQRESEAHQLRQDILNAKPPGEVQIKENSSFNDNQDLLVPKTTNKKVTLVNVQDILKKDEKPKPNPCHVVSAASFIDYERSFLGLLTPSSEWLEKFHKMLNLNLNTVIRQIRLLEWATLVQRHKLGSLQLWFNNKKYNNIILTEDRKRPSKCHMNIKTFEKCTLQNYRLPEIITSLYSNRLPGVATKDTETYVILVYNGISWEARGTIVLNDTSEMCRQRLGHKPTPTYILNPVLTFDKSYTPILPKTQTTVLPTPPLTVSNANPNILIRSTSSISVEVVNKDNNATPVNKPTESGLEITKIPLQNQNNQNLEIIKPAVKKENHILAPLPTGFGMSRWFMLILKNDFSVIRISFSNFHIKYTHLITALETAKKNQKTVRIRSQDKNIDNPNNFGVYALPGFPDRIFFGPYGVDSEHGLETFRYVNGKLVNTKIYHKMRGSIEKNTTGIWYFHSSTVHNNLVLEPQKDNASSGSDCSTEMTSAEQAVKPHIEFVDLTENDSDNEEKPELDPLFNVLSADFSKKVSADITIEPVYDNVPKQTILEVKKNDVVIQPISHDDTARLSVIQKENGLKKRKLSSSVPQKQPTLIDSIELDDDDEPPEKRRYSDSLKQVPGLCPINTMQNINTDVLKKRKVIYVITNIPGVGYFEILITDKRCMKLNINGKAAMFPTISMALTWLHQLFRRYIYFIPTDLKVKFSILESTDTPEMSKFNENFLNGYHMMCEKGVFDILRLSTEDMMNLGFNEQQSSSLLAHKCELLISRNIKILGNYLVGPEESNKLERGKILQMAPRQIKIIESRETHLQKQKTELKTKQAELMVKINELLKGVPESLKKLTRDKVCDILKISREGNSPLPTGKVKIVDGKVVKMDSSPKSFEMLVPITGLHTPVTVVGVQPQIQSPTTTSLLKTARQKVVDLTDD